MQRAFPKWFVLFGWVTYPMATLLILRLLWEKTFLTWSEGEQMIGFSLVHIYPELFLIGVVAKVFCYVWLVVAGALLIRRRAVITGPDKIQFTTLLFTILVDIVPYGFWIAVGRGLSLMN